MAATLSAALRRSRHLVSYWHDGELLFHNYATGVRVAVQPETPVVLDFFDNWRTPAEVRARFGASSRGVAALLAATLLERRADAGSAPFDAWANWNPAAGFFHTATRGDRYQDPLETDRQLRRKAKDEPLPPVTRRFPGAARHYFERLRVHREFHRVLSDRRTWRTFARRPLPLAVLGELLGWTNGVHHWATLRGQGVLPLKTSPSGGARHPLEAYVCARRVDGLAPGIYHYAADDHCLELVRAHDRPMRVQRYFPGQFYFEGAAALLFFTAVFARYQWKYDTARAYRAVFIEAGHQCQTFCLAATDLGLAPFCTMALADGPIETDLGIDGVSEAAVYAAGVGVRPRDAVSPSRPPGYPRLVVRPNPNLVEPPSRPGRRGR